MESANLNSTTWSDIATKDFQGAVRSKMLWGFIGVFVAFLLMALPVAGELFPANATVTPELALGGVAMLAQLFIPGIALVAGYMAVVGERRSGSLRVLLSYPFSRRDVVTGKLLGRSLVTGTALVVGYVVATVLVVALYGTPDVSGYLAFIGAGVLLGLTFTGLAVGGSAAVSTRGRAMSATIGSFMGMVFFWKPVLAGGHYAITGSLPGIHAPRWYFFAKRLNPLEAFRVLASSALAEEVSAVPEFPVEDIPPTTSPAQLHLRNRISGEIPYYLDDWFSVVVLVVWAVIPVMIGYWRFERVDIG